MWLLIIDQKHQPEEWMALVFPRSAGAEASSCSMLRLTKINMVKTSKAIGFSKSILMRTALGYVRILGLGRYSLPPDQLLHQRGIYRVARRGICELPCLSC